MLIKPSPELELSLPHDDAHSRRCLFKQPAGLSRRLSNWRGQQLARRALSAAGEPSLVLDLPCGSGRFWPVLAEKSNRVILAADKSSDMIQLARQNQPADVVARVHSFQTCAFAIDLDNAAVDSIFSMRLLHRFAAPEQRLAMLREFHRVTRDTLIVSLWVDGNFKSWRRKRVERIRLERGANRDNANCFVVARSQIETEFSSAGFKILEHHDFLPGYAMWRIYTLRKSI